MSLENHELDYILNMQADLDFAIAEKDWKECRTIIADVKEQGYEHEARMMQDSLKRATENDPNQFVAKTAHMTDKEVVEGYMEVSEDHRDYMDRHYP
jgi:hypothetical protein